MQAVIIRETTKKRGRKMAILKSSGEKGYIINTKAVPVEVKPGQEHTLNFVRRESGGLVFEWPVAQA